VVFICFIKYLLFHFEPPADCVVAVGDQHWVSGHKGQCGALSAQKEYIATTKQTQPPPGKPAPPPTRQAQLKKSTEGGANAGAPSLFSPTQRTLARCPASLSCTRASLHTSPRTLT
jgi:hypothetical protein